ncbi:TolC family protein [Porphyromonas sp.]|uniref:TolC family protein n=1 Tax=Porphyromonas sp. TaxID=1924944 RepID=UPI0026DB2AF2|nr:TolC family protein [Porphyromonas sp.]MDO4771755.1 TolC family protein [Porphyromonas sp.]
MRTFIITILTLLVSSSTFAQNPIDAILREIERNNTALQALRHESEAQKLDNKTGIFLANPEVELGYQWGHPKDIGHRTELSVSQSFDIPTITGMKSRLAKGKNTLIDYRYRSGRLTILLEAKQCCIDLIYNNVQRNEYARRLQHAELIASAYKTRMDKGDANIIEYNKALLSLTNIRNRMTLLETENQALLTQLRQLNGGHPVILETSEYFDQNLPLDFDTWYGQAESKSPLMSEVRQEIEISKRQVAINKALGLPTFSAGYASEKVAQERFQGLSVSVSIPLWENTNRVRQAKAAVKAAQSKEEDAQRMFQTRLRTLYEQAAGLKNVVDNYSRILSEANSEHLLKKALDAGEISLLDYLLELGLYYDTVDRAMEAERNFQKTLAELLATDL